MPRQAIQKSVDLAVSSTVDLTALINDARVSDGLRTWVTGVGATHGLWCLDQTSVAAVNGTTVVATFSGVGRWIFFGSSAAMAPQVGGIFIDDGVAPQNIDIAPSKLLNWHDNSPAIGVIPDFTNNQITVAVAGIYMVFLSISATFPPARTLYLHVAVNGLVAPMSGIKRVNSAGTSAGGSTSGPLLLSAGDVLTVLVSTDVNGQSLTILEAGFSVMKAA